MITSQLSLLVVRCLIIYIIKIMSSYDIDVYESPYKQEPDFLFHLMVLVYSPNEIN